MSGSGRGGAPPPEGGGWRRGWPLPPPVPPGGEEEHGAGEPSEDAPAPFAPVPERRERDPFRRRAGEGMEHVTWSLRATITGAAIVLLPLLLLLLGTTADEPAADPTVAEAVISQIVLSVFMGGVALAAAWLGSRAAQRGRLAVALGFRRFRPVAIAWLALAYMAYFAASIVIFLLLEPEQEDVTQFLGAEEGTLGMIVAGTMIVLVAPVVEEVLFRGFFHAGLRRSLPFLPAALVTSGLFGLIHYTGPETVGVVPQLAIFGLALAWLYEKTGSLWPPIALHALNNGLAFTILVADLDEELTESAVRTFTVLPL